MNYLAKYVQYTKEHEACELYHIWVAISMAAACLERRIWMHESFGRRVFTNMYIILVSPPGAGKKSSAIDIGMDMVKTVDGLQQPADKLTAESLIMAMHEALNQYQIPEEKRGDKPNTLWLPHCSLTVVADELEVFINDKAGEGIITLLTGLYKGYDRWEYKPKNSEPHTFINSWLNIIAGTTPGFFQKRHFLDGCTGGFTARIIFVWGVMKKRFIGIDRDWRLSDQIKQDMVRMSGMYGEMKMDSAAWKVYKGWYLGQPLQFDVIDELQHYYHRKGTHVLKVAMVLAASEGLMTMYPEHLHLAQTILERTEKDLPRVFQSVGRSSVGAELIRIQDMVYEAPGQEIYLAELIKRTKRNVNWQEFGDIINQLKAGGAILSRMCKHSQREIIYWNKDAEETRKVKREEGNG